ncbi:hypothetical protein M406DRAFT_320393, partial [Cryphonectria parasitica EP155]
MTPLGIPLGGGGTGSHGQAQHMGTAASGGRALINSVYGIPGTSTSHSLLPHQTQVWDSEVSRDLEVQRQFLMNQKQADATRREARRAERARGERKFEVRMRSEAQLMEAHRDAMRRMQSGAK